MGCRSGETGDPRDWEPLGPGLGQQKAEPAGSLSALGLKWHCVLTAESGLVRKKVLLFSSVCAATTLIVARWPSPGDGSVWADLWAWLFSLPAVCACIPLLWFLRFFLVLSA